MTTATSLETGYVLEAVFFPLQQLTPSPAPDTALDESISWGWDWRWNDAERFEVGLIFGASPVPTRPEKLEVAATAVFRVIGETQTVPVEEFAHTHASALLFPYVRQVVDELTMRSPYGRMLLPPTNVIALMTNFEASIATGTMQGRPQHAVGESKRAGADRKE